MGWIGEFGDWETIIILALGAVQASLCQCACSPLSTTP